ncbi:MAG: hypothetical protein HQL14_08705 [Candidatus Omnitrophica bacterium]|nr:hypothetical protein [Candidatus Omnitrophota bacterium]
MTEKDSITSTRSTTIVPIAFYCFLLGVFCFSGAVNIILSNNLISSGADLGWWLPVGALLIFTAGLAVIGIGILSLNKLCWKILFFSLAICISMIGALVFVILIFLLLGSCFSCSYFQPSQISSVTWFSFLSFFLSEIIVLYYLAGYEVVSCFGGMGELTSTF